MAYLTHGLLLDTWFITSHMVYLPLIVSLFLYCCQCSCIVSACVVRAVTLTEGFPCFFLSCKANARV